MEVSPVVVFLLCLLVTFSEAIRCECNKESETVSCSEGACEVDGGSCLMLDHPTLGVHYTCHTRTLQDGSCRNKTSKSHQQVKICGCDSRDMCNVEYWPDGYVEGFVRPPSRDQRGEKGEKGVEATNGASLPSLFLLPLTLPLFIW